MAKNIIDITKIPVTLPAINKGKDTLLLTGGGIPVYEYKDNQKTDKIIAHEYPVLIPGLGFERYYLKIVGELTPSITNDKFQPTDSPLPVKAEGFVGKIYRTREGNYALSATVTALKLI